MKKLFFVIGFIGILALAFLYAEQATGADFRKATWGMSQQAVIELEGKDISTKNKSDDGLDMIVYVRKQGGLDCIAIYYFAEDRLVEGRYIFTAKHTNKNLYIDDYLSVKASLAKKYGTPKVDDIQWNNDLYKDDKSQWGFAVSLGHLVYSSGWDTGRSLIVNILEGDNYKINHILIYRTAIPELVALCDKVSRAARDIW